MSQELNHEGTQEPHSGQQAFGLDSTNQLITHARTELGRVISGQGNAIEEVLFAVLCQGHALIEGVPGIAKTLMVKTLGRFFDLAPTTSHFSRVLSSPTFCLWTKSTVCHREPRPPFSNAWKNAR